MLTEPFGCLHGAAMTATSPPPWHTSSLPLYFRLLGLCITRGSHSSLVTVHRFLPFCCLLFDNGHIVGYRHYVRIKGGKS